MSRAKKLAVLPGDRLNRRNYTASLQVNVLSNIKEKKKMKISFMQFLLDAHGFMSKHF